MEIYINLLPQELKKEIKREKIFRALIQQGIIFLFPLLVLIGILGGINFLLGLQKDMVMQENQIQQSQSKYAELKQYEDAFAQTNELAKSIGKIESTHFHWTKILTKISEIVPQGVTFENITTKNLQVFILGRAKNREDLLAFKEKLLGESCFSDVNIPLSNMVVRENVDFQMDFSIKKECLNK